MFPVLVPSGCSMLGQYRSIYEKSVFTSHAESFITTMSLNGIFTVVKTCVSGLLSLYKDIAVAQALVCLHRYKMGS